MDLKLEKVKLNIDKNSSKYEINYEYKTKIKELFGQFCSEIKNYLKQYVDNDVSKDLVDKLLKDYNKYYTDNDYKLEFIYPYELFKGQKGLKDNNYEKLLKSNYTEEEKTYYIINSELKKIFENLDKSINKTKYQTNLSVKQLFNYNYFIDSQPRCCFCGQLLECSIKEDRHNDKKKEEYLHADIEHIIPKDQFPQFTLHPDNWAPCCKECNMGEKRTAFFKDGTTQEKIDKYKSAIKALGLEYNKLHPLKLWNNYKITYNNSLKIEINNNLSEEAKKFLSFYGIEHRIETMASRCYDILFNIIRHSDIRSPESLERLLENMVSSNWHEINDGYSLNNSPQIWQEFIESILYNECKLMALWDEVKSMNMSIF